MIINLLRYINHSLSLAVVLFVSLGYLLSLIFPTTILVWDILLISTAIAGFGLVYLLEGHPIKQNSEYSLKSLALGILPLLIFIVPFFNIFTSVEAQFSRHGDLYGAYTMEILYRTGQPDNVFVFGSVANYPWLYQALVASLSHLFGMPVPLARSFVALYTFLATLGWVFESLPLLLNRKHSPFVLAMLACFVMLGINLFGFLHSMIDMWDNFHWANIFSLIAPETFIASARLQNGLIGKFTQFTTTGMGFLYAWLCIYAALRFITKREAFYSLFWFAIGSAGGIAFLMVGGFFIPALLVFGYVVALAFAYFGKNPEYKTLLPSLTKREMLLAGAVCALVFVQAYYFWSSRSAGSGTVGFSLRDLGNFTMVFGNYYPLFPFLLIFVLIAWVEKKPLYIFLVAACGLALAIGLTINIGTEPYAGNEYKLILFSTFILSLSTVPVFEYLQISLMDKQQKAHTFSMLNLLSFIVYFCVAMNVLGVSARIYEIYERWEMQRGYYYEGTSILRQNNPYEGIFRWLRSQTDGNTILLMPLERNFDTHVLSQRLPYVSLSNWGLGESSLLYAEHIQNLRAIYEQSPGTAEWETALNTIISSLDGSPLILIVPVESTLIEFNLSAYDFQLVYTEPIAYLYEYLP